MIEESLFHEALAKPPADRAAFLDAACAGNPALRAAVEALLAAHAASGPFLDPPEHTGAFSPEPGTAEFGAAQPGALVAGRYTLEQKLGEGGMGEVWVAKQTEPVKRRVALKLIKAGMDSRAVVQRFEQERQALALMDHPNIARVLDGGLTESRRPFFVMELVNGLPLTRFCDEAKLTPRERLELFVPVCQAVQHAHQKGVVHRDLKPSNILVTLIDGKGIPKVIDFGVAKATGGKLTDESLSTQFGAVVGTLEYMSPEQAGFSGADIDTRADIYSLGVILYELLTGLKPHDARRLRQAAFTEMVRIIQEEEPSKPSTRLSTDDALPSLAALRQTEPRRLTALLRGELDWVVMKCLEKQRDRRYETANGLAREVQRYLADEPVEARPPSTRYRLAKFLRRNKGPVLAAAAVAAVLVFGIVGTTAGMFYADAQRRRAVIAENDAKAQTAIAVAAREVSDDRFDLALAAIDGYLSRVTENPKLRDQDFFDLRQQLLRAAEPLLEKLAKEKPGDPAQAFVQVSALMRLAAIASALGDHRGGEAKLRDALAILQSLPAESAAPDQLAHRLSHCLNALGRSLEHQGKLAEAAAVFEGAIRTAEERLARNSADRKNQNDLSTLLTNAGSTASALRQFDRMETYLRRALELEKALAAGAPGDAEGSKSLAGAFNNLAILLSAEERYGDTKLPEAIDLLKEAIRIQEPLAKTLPSPARRQFLSNHHQTIATFYGRLKQFGPCQEHLTAAKDLRVALAKDFPTVPEYRKQLAETHETLAEALDDVGKKADALAEYRHALALQERLAADHPQVAAYLRGHAVALAKYCRARRPAEDVAADWEKSLALLASVLRHPNVQSADFRLLSVELNNYALYLSDRRRYADSERWYRECTRVAEEEMKRWPNDAHGFDYAARGYGAIGVISLEGNRLAEALAAFRKGREIHRRLEQIDSEAATKAIHWSHLSGLAHALHKSGEPAEAERHYRLAMEGMRKLLAKTPTDYRLIDIHIRIVTKTAFLLNEMRRHDESVELAKETLAHSRTMFALDPKKSDYRFLLESCLVNTGTLLADQRKFGQAMPLLTEAVKMAEESVAAAPENRKLRGSLGAAHRAIAHALALNLNYAAAMPHFNESIAAFETACAQDRADLQMRQQLGSSFGWRGELFYFQKQYESAVKDLTRSIELADAPENPRRRMTRAISNAHLGRVDEAVAEAEALTAGAPAAVLYRAVCAYALSYAKSKDEKHALRAIELLKQSLALEYGRPEKLMADTDLDSLRQRPDYQAILARLGRKPRP